MSNCERFPIDPPPYPQSNLNTANDIYWMVNMARSWAISRLPMFDIDPFKEKVKEVRAAIPEMPDIKILSSVPIQVLEHNREMICRLRDEHDKLIKIWETSWKTTSGNINEDFFAQYIQLIESAGMIVDRAFQTRAEVNAQGASAQRKAMEGLARVLKNSPFSPFFPGIDSDAEEDAGQD